MVIPQRSRTRAMNARLLPALRMPMVPTATTAEAWWRRASSAMPVIASAVRSIASGAMSPVSAMPSPRRVTSARSTMRGPGAVVVSFADVELDRVGPHVDDREHCAGHDQPPMPTAALSHRG